MNNYYNLAISLFESNYSQKIKGNIFGEISIDKDLNDNIINLEDVVTHIHLSSIHFRLENNKHNIYLNDNNPLDKCYNKVWEQLASYKKICKGKVILMIGRENGLSTLFEDFDIYYNLLKSAIPNRFPSKSNKPILYAEDGKAFA